MKIVYLLQKIPIILTMQDIVVSFISVHDVIVLLYRKSTKIALLELNPLINALIGGCENI